MDSHSSNLLSGLYTSYTAHLHRDKALLKRLLKVQPTGWGLDVGTWCGVKDAEYQLRRRLSPLVLLQGVQKKRPWDVQSALLRRHLLELTQSFIIPLVRRAGVCQPWACGRHGRG